jgi:hypothetical protein
MTLRTFARLRSLLSLALFVAIAFIAWGCANVSSPFAANQTALGIRISVTPASTSVPVSGTTKFTASVANTSDPAVTWQVNGVTGGETTHGTIDTTGLYTAPAAVPSPAAVTIAAVSQAQPTKVATAQVVISTTPAAIVVAVSPSSISVHTGHLQTLTATLQNDSQNKGVTWTLSGGGCNGAACGTLSAMASTSGTAITYTAPANVPSPASVTATATSVADSSKTAVVTITLASTAPPPAIAVAVNPSTVSVQTGHPQALTATVQNDALNKGASWTLKGAGCSGAACGTLSAASSASGAAITYTAPATAPSPGTVTLTATSVADPSKAAVATITVTGVVVPPAIVIAVNPATVAVQTGHTQSLTATVQNDADDKGVNWTLTGAGCNGASCGNLSAASSASGAAITYTAPAAVPTPAAVTATATSVKDSQKSASTTITITAPVSGGTASVAISPVRVALTTGQAQTFTATVTGNAVTSVTWEVDSIPGGNSSVGTVSASGVYSPPSSAGTHTVAARSVADTTATASASVSITDFQGVFAYHNDLSRDGVNSQEYALNTSTVKGATFGKRFACAIDAAAYAQPLWVANLAIGGGTHNVLVAATQHDTVYAFDADASPCQTYWSKSLLDNGEKWVTSGDVNSNDISPDIGIVGTPVIDPGTNTIYVVSKSKNGSNFHQRLHALSLIDGSEKFNGPQDITFSSGGVNFNALTQNQRCGLALVNGVVYIAYASHGDNPTYFGWIVGYSASSLNQVALFNDDPGSGFGGIWMSGGAPAADSSGNLYVITGNGNFDGNTQFGDSFLKLSTSGGINVGSFFSPSNQASENSGDLDFGSGGAAILVDPSAGPVPHLAIGGGKDGKMFLLNRDNLGGNSGNDGGAVQAFSVGNMIFATAAFWQNTLYIGPITDHVKSFTLNTSTGQFNTAPASQSPSTFGFPGATPSISAQGGTNGIVWAIENAGTAVLHAYDATNLGSELWDSGNSGADQAGGAVKFTVPTVANGKVYVGTASEISVYGLSPK